MGARGQQCQGSRRGCTCSGQGFGAEELHGASHPKPFCGTRGSLPPRHSEFYIYIHNSACGPWQYQLFLLAGSMKKQKGFLNFFFLYFPHYLGFSVVAVKCLGFIQRGLFGRALFPLLKELRGAAFSPFPVCHPCRGSAQLQPGAKPREGKVLLYPPQSADFAAQERTGPGTQRVLHIPPVAGSSRSLHGALYLSEHIGSEPASPGSEQL